MTKKIGVGGVRRANTFANRTTHMNEPTDSFDPRLEIRRPCPKRWADLVGDDTRRFCSECSLHVHNATRLSRREAQELVASNRSRVCMRVEYDDRGRPVFADSKRAASPSPSVFASGVRWTIRALTGLLAACSGAVDSSEPTPASTAPESAQMTEKLGDFAGPPQSAPIEVLGGITAEEFETPPDAPPPPR
jgi:hypothetical protein